MNSTNNTDVRSGRRFAEAVDAVKRAAAKLEPGQAMTQALYARHRRDDDMRLATLKRVGFGDVCRAARVPVSRAGLRVARDPAYERALRELESKLGRAPSRADWRRHRPAGFPRETSLCGAYGGTWLDVLSAAGCAAAHKQVALHQAADARRRRALRTKAA